MLYFSMSRSSTIQAPAQERALSAQIQQKLDTLFPAAEGRRWLDTSQQPLGGSPRELIARGEAERVLRLLIRLEQGIPT